MQTAFRKQKKQKKHHLSLAELKESFEKDLSTEGDDSPRSPRDTQDYPGKLNKEKLELCRKYLEYGYCPYGTKCKFAHGSH